MRAPLLTEAQLHRQVADYLDLVLPPAVPWTTIGHGGGGYVRGAQLKGRGVKPGWPDIHFVCRGLPCYIELKTRRGRVSPEQKEIHRMLIAAGAHVAVCRSLEEVQVTLRLLDVPMLFAVLV